MKLFINILLLSLLSTASMNAYSDYNSVGVRDPMVKTIRQKIEEKTEKKAEEKKAAIIRQREIYNIINKCRIEGVVISNGKRLVLINDRLLAEGDKISPDCDVYVYKIDYKLIKFSLDGQIAIYSLNTSK